MIPTYFNITLIYIWTPLHAFTLRNAHHRQFVTPLDCRFSPWFVKVGWDNQDYHHWFKNSSDKINHRRLSGWFGSPWKLKFLKSLILKSIFKICFKNQTSFELYLNFPWSSYPSQAPPTCLWVPHPNMCAAHCARWQHNEPTSRSRSLSLRSSSPDSICMPLPGTRHQQSPSPNIIRTRHHGIQHQLASPHQTPPPTTTTLTPSWCKGSTYLATSLSLLLHHAREATQPTWYTPAARAAHTETTEATHAQHSKQARTKAAAQGWTRNQGRSALPTTPERVLFRLPVPSHHVFTRQHASSSPYHRCPAKGTPRQIGEPVAQHLPGQPPIKCDAELCPTKDYLNETLGLCPTKLCFTFREKESNGCHESRQSNQ